jgi:hypothetical protein
VFSIVDPSFYATKNVNGSATKRERAALHWRRAVGVLAVRSKNERVELEMKLMRCRQLTNRITDEEFLGRIKEQIAELKRKLPEIDPRSRGFEPLQRDVAKPTTERALFSFRISGFEHQCKI